MVWNEKKEFYRVADTDTKKNSGAPKAGVCFTNLNHNKDKSSANQGTSAPSGGDRKQQPLRSHQRNDLRSGIITRISSVICHLFARIYHPF